MSLYMEILDAVKQALAATPGPAPTVREIPYTLPADEPLPARFVCPGAEGGERVSRVTFGGNVRWRYSVLILLLAAGNRTVQAGMEGRLDQREAGRNAVYVPRLTGVAEVYNVDIEPKAVADVAAALGSNVNVSGFLLYYITNEVTDWGVGGGREG